MASEPSSSKRDNEPTAQLKAARSIRGRADIIVICITVIFCLSVVLYLSRYADAATYLRFKELVAMAVSSLQSLIASGLSLMH